jgi:sortase A
MLRRWNAEANVLAQPVPSTGKKPCTLGKDATLFTKVTAPARTTVTLLGLLFLGLAAAVRTKPASERQRGSTAGHDVDAEGPLTPRPVLVPSPKERPTGRKGRRLGKVLIVLGVLLLGYSAAVVFWRDPATDLYARWKQHQLSGQLNDIFAEYASTATVPQPAKERSALPTREELVQAEREEVEKAANRLKRRLKLGKPLGRISVPKLGLNAVFVQGTRWGPDLSQGPGHYPESSLPGVGRTMAIAGHRTTFGAPFRHIDSLKRGNQITLRLPYATFHYRVFKHKIVDNGDWRIIHDRGFDTLVLSACHPLYSAKQRWVVFAALYRVDPVKGVSYAVNRRNDVRAVRA